MPLLALLIALAAPPNGLADACASAAEQAEPLKKAGHFSEALSALERCVSNSCPKAVNEYCRAMKSELDLAQPTIEVSIQDEQLGRLMSARVMLDGVEKGWSPGALPVDPGVHQLHVELEGYVPHDEALGLRAGEKRRPVIVVMKPAELWAQA